MKISPSSKSNIPAIDFKVVVLPAPLCPINANISPLFTLRDILSTAFFRCYKFY